jgi:hypothetical protein
MVCSTCTIKGERICLHIAISSDYKQDYSREFGMACWCDDMELCENEEHA